MSMRKIKVTEKHQNLSPEAEQKPYPTEGLKILARMISRAHLAKHIDTDMKKQYPFPQYVEDNKTFGENLP